MWCILSQSDTGVMMLIWSLPFLGKEQRNKRAFRAEFDHAQLPPGVCPVPPAHGEPGRESRNNSGIPKALPGFPALQPEENLPRWVAGAQQQSSHQDGCLPLEPGTSQTQNVGQD